ncbi:MAG TPA: hypothetical protein VFT15_13530, partial [Chitinophagaceae bacterium]|nr:hypothetical protein [Chitinophagaceae bacterium]
VMDKRRHPSISRKVSVGRSLEGGPIVFVPVGYKNIIFITRNDGRHIAKYTKRNAFGKAPQLNKFTRKNPSFARNMNRSYGLERTRQQLSM